MSDVDRPVLERADDGDSEAPADSEELGRRRRPTGEPPPLPPDVRWRGIRWGLLALVAVGGSLALLAYSESRLVIGFDLAVSRWAVGLRSDASVGTARALDVVTSPVAIAILRWTVVGILVAVRRLRHLAVLLLTLFLVEWIVTGMNFTITRPRPMVPIVGTWVGFSHPSRPIAALAVTLLVAVRVLVPHGPWRRGVTSAVVAVVAAVGLGRVLLGVDHVSDVLVAAAIGLGLPLMTFRLLAPTARHPVVYRRGETAHVDLEGDRREAVEKALRDQAGVEVLGLELHGADGSAGSTPMKVTVRDRGGERTFFAKLYTRQHLHSDRIYKVFRSVIYGRLEDEQPFSSVRRLVQYEDHMSRLVRDAGVLTPEPLGVFEITPDREYLIAFGFVDGEDIDKVEVDDEIIDEGLETIQRLWAAGIAHRDLKPANIMVADGRINLIDTAFAQIRPTPWRQAVDLGAMMLVLALQTDPERVYERARAMFSEEELGEAFAATRGFAIPGQLQRHLAEDDRDVLERMRGLAPDHPPISVQRWDRGRITTAAALLAGLAAVAYAAWVSLDSVGMV